MNRTMQFFPCIILILSISLSCLNPALGQTPPAKSPELLSKGKKVYEQKCASCHGLQGNAQTPFAKILKPPPRDFSQPLNNWTVSQGDPARVFKVIKTGIPSTAMVKFDLPDEDVWALVYTVLDFSR